MPPQKIHLPRGALRATYNPVGPPRDAMLKQICLSRQLTGLFLLTPSASKGDGEGVPSHTYLSCNQIFSIWRESKCCNCFPTRDRKWHWETFPTCDFISIRHDWGVGWDNWKEAKITRKRLTERFCFTRDLPLTVGTPCCLSLKQHAYKH